MVLPAKFSHTYPAVLYPRLVYFFFRAHLPCCALKNFFGCAPTLLCSKFFFRAHLPCCGLSVHRTPAGLRVFFRFSKNAPLRGAGHRTHQGHRTRQKSALLTFNHDRLIIMPCKSTLNNKERIAEAAQAYNSGKFSSISAAAREFSIT